MKRKIIKDGYSKLTEIIVKDDLLLRHAEILGFVRLAKVSVSFITLLKGSTTEKLFERKSFRINNLYQIIIQVSFLHRRMVRFSIRSFFVSSE